MTSAPRLVQYWDTGAPPPEVDDLMATWARDPAFAYHAFSRDQAMAYLSDRFLAPVVAAFAKCRYPAMQADLFRYCTLWAEGGFYVDADTANGGGLTAMVEGCGRGCLMDRRGNMANDFLYVAAPGDALFAHVIDRAVANIAGAVSNNVWAVTGPGIMTGLFADPATRPMFAGFRILPVAEVRKVVLFRWDLDYKKTADDWRDALTAPDKSIFR